MTVLFVGEKYKLSYPQSCYLKGVSAATKKQLKFWSSKPTLHLRLLFGENVKSRLFYLN